jgi:hypothetical protein
MTECGWSKSLHRDTHRSTGKEQNGTFALMRYRMQFILRVSEMNAQRRRILPISNRMLQCGLNSVNPSRGLLEGWRRLFSEAFLHALDVTPKEMALATG